MPKKKESSSKQAPKKASSPPKEKGSSSSLKGNEIKIVTNVKKDKYLWGDYPLVHLHNPYTPRDPYSNTSNDQEAIIIDVCRDEDEKLYQYKMMHTLNHQNVLSCYYIQEADENICKMFNKEKNFKIDDGAKYYAVVTEKFDGNLRELLHSKRDKMFIKNKYIPSYTCTKVIRSIVDVLWFLHVKKTYHGNFTFERTLFVFKGSKIVVKLTNFIEKKEASLEQAQLQDWWDLGNSLDNVLVNMCGGDVFTGHLIRARDFFLNITTDQIATMDEHLSRLDFFQTPEDRWMHARQIYSWYQRYEKYLQREHADLVPMPWNRFKTKCGNLVLKSMNDFKDKDGKQGPTKNYDTNDVVSLLRFVSGAYAHYNTLRVPELGDGLLAVDEFICAEFPDLFYNVREIENELQG